VQIGILNWLFLSNFFQNLLNFINILLSHLLRGVFLGEKVLSWDDLGQLFDELRFQGWIDLIRHFFVHVVEIELEIVNFFYDSLSH